MHDPQFAWARLAWLCLAALIAGAVNSIAGGGTLLTFPALVGVLSTEETVLATVIANATSTVALVPASLAGAWGYRRKMNEARRWLLLLAPPSVLGGIVGSLLLTRLNPAYFSALIPWLLLTAAALFLFDTVVPRQATAVAGSNLRPGAVIGLVLFQFVVAVYGGYFGAGIGIMMLTALAMMGVGDINQMNALKTLLASFINGISVFIFIADGKVAWRYALPMAVAGIVGGYLGAAGALRVRPRAVRWIVIGIGFGLAAYFFSRQLTH